MNEKKLRQKIEELFDTLSRNYVIDVLLSREDCSQLETLSQIHMILYPQAYEEEEE